MKKIIKIVLVNIAILIILLVVLELVLRVTGMDTIVDMEKNAPGWARYKRACEKISKQKLEAYNQFYTDREGLFKANPEYFADSRNKDEHDVPINRDGFRGNPFEYVKTSRPKILLIGDSFTWGATAKPITNSFADLLQEAGYYVYNAGIPGTDPLQYAMIAEKYTARLKPDIVAVCVYIGNDISINPALMEPNKNLHYVTNFGFLKGYDDDGHFFKNAQEAFEYMKKRKCGYVTGPGDYFIYKTVIGRKILGALTRENKSPKFDGTKKWVRDSLQRIQNACEKNGTKCIIFLIPFVNQDIQKNKSIQKNIHLFEGFSFYYPNDMGKSDYCKSPNSHFNNLGHRKYADFMISVLKQNGFDNK
jgi:hypothetical protein